MPRREHKYLVPGHELSRVRRLLLPHVDADPFMGHTTTDGYSVRSLYLDTGNLDFYRDKVEGIRNRKKLRIRGYNHVRSSDPVFLEIKRKAGSAVIKQRSMLSFRNLLPLLESGDIEMYLEPSPTLNDAREHARRFLFHYHSRGLSPVVTVVYEREAFFCNSNRGVRITLDRNLRFHQSACFGSLLEEYPDVAAIPGFFILEIKTDSGIPIWLRMLLGRLGANQEALSKYAICVGSLMGNGHSWRASRSGRMQYHGFKPDEGE